MFGSSMSESTKYEVNFGDESTNPLIIQTILEYCYTDSIQLSDGSIALELLIATNQYGLV